MCTSHALINLVEEISSSLDANKFSIGVFIDLKKVFDTVNLHDRKQFVQIDDCKSTLLYVNCGVPQGSILGTKLFIIIFCI